MCYNIDTVKVQSATKGIDYYDRKGISDQI